MERRRVVAAGTVLLGVLAIAATAGTYAENSDSTAGSGIGPNPIGGSAGVENPVTMPGWVLENFLLLLFGLCTTLILLGVLVTVALRGMEGLEAVLRWMTHHAIAAGIVAALFAGAALLARLFSGPAGDRPSGTGRPRPTPGSGGGAGEAGAAGGETIMPVLMVVGTLLVLCVVFFVALDRRRSEPSTSAGGIPGPATPTDVADDAPMRYAAIEDVPETNEIYRAWRQLATQVVDARDRTVTASDVARSAVRAGFDREAVRTITDRFEEVRYGRRPVTAEREREATAALESLDGIGGDRS